MIIVGKLWINMNLIFVLTDPTKSTFFRKINFCSLTVIKKRTKYCIYLTLPAYFLVRNIKFNVHISIIIHIMIKILSFVFWKQDTFSWTDPYLRRLCTTCRLKSETVAVHRGMNMVLDYYDGQMITGDECGPNLLTFVLLLKKLNLRIDPTADRTRAPCVRGNDVTWWP